MPLWVVPLGCRTGRGQNARRRAALDNRLRSSALGCGLPTVQAAIVACVSFRCCPWRARRRHDESPPQEGPRRGRGRLNQGPAPAFVLAEQIPVLDRMEIEDAGATPEKPAAE